MLGKAQALSNKPYDAYGGPLTAGASTLQNNAFKGIGSLATPSAIGNAATTAGNVATNLSGMSYSPTTSTNQFNAPNAYQPTTSTNQFNAPDAYKSVGSGFDADQASQYMNPYLQMSLQPQIEEARRQSQITQMQNAAKMTKTGSFGGGRQAIMDAETQRNLGTNLANITGQGYNTAFTNAQTQFNADQLRKIQEAQYGSTQGMTAAQSQAQYGLSAEQEAEKSKQFGANYGLDAQKAALAAAQTQSNLGVTQNTTDLANIKAQLEAGATQRGIENEGITADVNEFNTQRDYDQQQVKFLNSLLQGLPISTVANVPQGQTTGQQFTGNMADVTKLLKELKLIT
jgi:hypothetical protein